MIRFEMNMNKFSCRTCMHSQEENRILQHHRHESYHHAVS